MSAQATSTLADDVLAYVEADSSHLTDPLTAAAECAKLVVAGGARDPSEIVAAVNSAMPASSTVLERGIALGMAVAVRASEERGRE